MIITRRGLLGGALATLAAVPAHAAGLFTVHRDEWQIFNGDMMQWDHLNGVYWPGPFGGPTSATNWNGGPGIGGSVYVGRFPLNAAQTNLMRTRYALYYSVAQPATQGEDQQPGGWMTIVESSSDGGSTTGIITPWGVAQWAGKRIGLTAWLSTNQAVSTRLVAWQSYGGGGTPFQGTIAGPERVVQPQEGWVQLSALLTIPPVQGETGSDPYVGVGLDIRAGFGGTLGVTAWRVVEVP